MHSLNIFNELSFIFRLKEPLAVNRGLFGELGAKFRYSGRTHYQSRIASSSIDRVAPEFDRSFSLRTTGSRSMLNYSCGSRFNSFMDCHRPIICTHGDNKNLLATVCIKSKLKK